MRIKRVYSHVEALEPRQAPQNPRLTMSTQILGSLHAMQARAVSSLDAIAAFWNRLPEEQEPRAPDNVVLAIFASAGGVSIAGALMLIAMVPR